MGMIGMHDYEGDFDIRPDNLQLRIANMARNYPFANGTNRLLWITEIAAGCGQSSLCRDPINRNLRIYRDGNIGWPQSPDDSISNEEQLWYMKQVVPYLESNDDVFRYSWFGIRTNSSFSGYPNLLPYDDPDDDTPTILGEYYATAEEGR